MNFRLERIGIITLLISANGGQGFPLPLLGSNDTLSFLLLLCYSVTIIMMQRNAFQGETGQDQWWPPHLWHSAGFTTSTTIIHCSADSQFHARSSSLLSRCLFYQPSLLTSLIPSIMAIQSLALCLEMPFKKAQRSSRLWCKNASRFYP